MSDPSDAAVHCALCGAPAAGAATLTWVRERGDDGTERMLCDGCARAHVRDIESRLSPEWW